MLITLMNVILSAHHETLEMFRAATYKALRCFLLCDDDTRLGVIRIHIGEGGLYTIWWSEECEMLGPKMARITSHIQSEENGAARIIHRIGEVGLLGLVVQVAHAEIKHLGNVGIDTYCSCCHMDRVVVAI